MKYLKTHILKLISIALIAAISAYSIIWGIKNTKKEKVLTYEKEQQTIYTIWHVETFEGGGKSRIEYLKNITRNMEKQNESILFMIKNIDPKNLQTELEISQPDIISFGFGVGNVVLPHLKSQEKTFDIRDELIESGSFNKKFYAIPYIVSGYAMFNHSMDSNEFHVGQTYYTAPENIYQNLNLIPSKSENQYEAYKNFVYNKKVQLLGTGRDLFRINNLNNIGRTNAIINTIDTYTDLIQYLGIINSNKTTEKFINLALSDSWQNTLYEYSLFSSKYNKLYSSGIYNDMENAIFCCRIPNVFNG